MQSKTPQFDALIDTVLENLVPHTRVCKWKGEHKYCEGKFNIEEGDIEFLKMFKVPPPNFCPTCRRMRRFVHMGVLRFFKRPCDAPDHSESMISIFPTECPFPVYDYKYFIGDQFNPFLFGLTYQDSSDPLEVLLNLRKIFPMPSFLNRDLLSINSEYSNGGRDTKNTYYAGGSFSSENIWYSSLINKSKDIMDSRDINKGDFVYGSISSNHIYKSSFIYFSSDCTESMFLFDCRNCTNCFGCVNLRNAKYCVWNEQYSKEDYDSFIESLYPLKRTSIALYKEKFWDLVKKLPRNASMNSSVENVSGIVLQNAKNIWNVTDARNVEHMRYADSCFGHQDSMDVLFSGKSSLLYGTVNTGSDSSNVRFSISSKFCTNSEFVFNCNKIDHCFMCFGLQNKSYCVLNTQYSKEEYFILVDKIKTQIVQKGEYGDGFGFEFSAQAYNFSLAQVPFPLTNEEIIKLGGYVANEPESNASGVKILSVENLPKYIDDVVDDIINCAIQCVVTGRPFKVTPSELQFLKQMKLPLPTVHPIVRMGEFFNFSPNGRMFDTKCNKCDEDLKSLFNPQDAYILYCEKCYHQEVC